ncbi:MAG: 1,4-dihydroxy-2-naphthoate polyprenyltransferase [Halodesulfurarchaeum sp.]
MSKKASTATTPEEAGEISRLRAWSIAIRPHTLPAGVAPVVVGTGLAMHRSVFAPVEAGFALVGALLLQIGTNLANDYFDAEQGVDSADSPGYTRVTQSGLIAGRRVFRAAMASFALAFVSGLYLVYVGGVPILVVGLASIASGLAYSGGPYPIGYHGLGDLFTFVFFGIVAVAGTYYVQAAAHVPGALPTWIPPGTLPLEAIVASLPMAGLITAILVVNNIRDIEDDRRSGKRTLAVLLGYRWSRVEYLTLFTLAYLVPLWFAIQPEYGLAVLLPLSTLPVAISATRRVLGHRDTSGLNPALERTVQLVGAFALLFAIGMAV